MTTSIFLIRHGQTLWSVSGQQTGRTDLDLTLEGQKEAKTLLARLKAVSFTHIFCSPLKRAVETCRLAGLFDHAILDQRLREWDYGCYEGLTKQEIRTQNPHWNVFNDGALGGESVQDIKKRADEFLDSISTFEGNIALFSHGHFLRALAARFLKLPVENGKLFYLSTASVSILGYEQQNPIMKLWNET